MLGVFVLLTNRKRSESSEKLNNLYLLTLPDLQFKIFKVNSFKVNKSSSASAHGKKSKARERERHLGRGAVGYLYRWAGLSHHAIKSTKPNSTYRHEDAERQGKKKQASKLNPVIESRQERQ